MENKIKNITGTAIMAALSIVMTVVSNYIVIGTISINLSLIPIALAAIIFGPWAGFICGMINGLVIVLAPSTAGFFAVSIPGTIIVCLLKCALAGLACGYTYKLFKKQKVVGGIVSSLLVPVLNTALFIIGSLIFFKGIFGELITIFVSVNFAIEFGVTAILSPAIVKIIDIYNKKNTK